MSSATGTSTPGSGTGEAFVQSYGHAIFEVAQAEDALERVEDELFRIARTVESSPALRERLSDARVDVATRLQVVDDLLGGRAHPQTVAAVNWVVQAGHARHLAAICDAAVGFAADSRAQAVAQVRAAVELSEDQRERLAQALRKSTGRDVTVKVVVDPDVVGGIVVTIGDTVIDGSIARRLSRMRDAIARS